MVIFHNYPALSGTESRIARFPESRAWNRQKFRSEKQKKRVESQQSRIAENRFRIAIRIAAYQYYAYPGIARFESHDSE